MLKTRIGYIICFLIILSLFIYSKSINTKSMELSFSQSTKHCLGTYRSQATKIPPIQSNRGYSFPKCHLETLLRFIFGVQDHRENTSIL